MRSNVLLILTLFFACTSARAYCTSEGEDTVALKKRSYNLNLGFLAGTSSSIPFWQRANQYGVIPTQGPGVIIGVAVAKPYTRKNWDWAYGVDLWGNAGEQNRILLPEAYVKGKFKKFEIWGGRRKQVMGIVGDTTLTIGPYIESGNSIPIPRIQIGFTDYVGIFNGLIGFKATFANGWFDPNPVIKGHYLHQKSAYLRLGKEKWPVRVTGGFNHNVQWAGTVVKPNRHTIGRKNPSSWKDYWYVVSGKRIPFFGYLDPTKYDAIDRGNRIGNHLGSIDIAMEIRMSNLDIVAYRSFFYDDGSLFYRANVQDGLNGVSLKFKKHDRKIFVSGITAEYLYTVNQGGDEFTLDGGPRGRDNYFNHIQYEGWVYKGDMIGTPFITSKLQTDRDLPKPSDFYISDNNRVQVIHLGISGGVNSTKILCKVSYSKNLGTYANSFNPGVGQVSAIADVNIPISLKNIKSLEAKMSIGADLGKLYPASCAIRVGVVKTGNF